MNLEKYSKRNFESRGLNALANRQLADELQEDVVKQMHDAVRTSFLKVIEGLNEQGHNLKPYDEIRPGDISFRDEPVAGQCYLRLGCDVVISAGYSDTRIEHDRNE